jgi:hypothetical protein
MVIAARPGPSRWLRRIAIALQLTCLCGIGDAVPAADQTATSQPSYVHWEYFAPIVIPDDADNKLVDVVLRPAIFTDAQLDLADLRVFDEKNRPVPYALRVLRPEFERRAFPAKDYNRSTSPEGVRELTLDLDRDNIEHNRVEIETPGSGFRRKVVVAGSNDGTTWRELATSSLVRFQRGEQEIDGHAVSYPPSRYRYIRIRVFPDPETDDEPVPIKDVSVVRRVELPGEILTFPAEAGERQNVRGEGGQGSAWLIDLGGERVPVAQLEVEVENDEFVRDYYVEAAAGTYNRFDRVRSKGERTWTRLAGEPKQPLVAKFDEVRTSRLRLVVTDHRNPPLRIRAVRYRAPARQVLFERPGAAQAELRLAFGHPEAEAPNYDFARSLPERLETAPARARLESIEVNPDYVPPPKPLTERWPWLIYVVLGTISVVLAVIIFSLARSAIAVHDRQVTAVG